MKFKPHYEIPKGSHAYLGASSFHWLNYDDEKLIQAYTRFLASQRGTELHEFAARCIELKQKLPDTQQTLNMYVNDAIDLGMQPEQTLYYSPNCFGTTDAISFKNDILRIHDYKSGETPAKFEQLMVYASLFCLEYGVNPNDIYIELRIYQFDLIHLYKPNITDIAPIMDKIAHFDTLINKIKTKEGD